MAFASVNVVFRVLLSLAMKSIRKSPMQPTPLCLVLKWSDRTLAEDFFSIEHLCSACLNANFLTVLPMYVSSHFVQVYRYTTYLSLHVYLGRELQILQLHVFRALLFCKKLTDCFPYSFISWIGKSNFLITFLIFLLHLSLMKGSFRVHTILNITHSFKNFTPISRPHFTTDHWRRWTPKARHPFNFNFLFFLRPINFFNESNIFTYVNSKWQCWLENWSTIYSKHWQSPCIKTTKMQILWCRQVRNFWQFFPSEIDLFYVNGKRNAVILDNISEWWHCVAFMALDLKPLLKNLTCCIVKPEIMKTSTSTKAFSESSNVNLSEWRKIDPGFATLNEISEATNAEKYQFLSEVRRFIAAASRTVQDKSPLKIDLFNKLTC